jgi:hypothetical protein
VKSGGEDSVTLDGEAFQKALRCGSLQKPGQTDTQPGVALIKANYSGVHDNSYNESVKQRNIATTKEHTVQFGLHDDDVAGGR